MSPPSRAAWIEIQGGEKNTVNTGSRRLHGRRGLKCSYIDKWYAVKGRRLHGRRGLKYRGCRYSMQQGQSPPSRAAWIEMSLKYQEWHYVDVAAFTGGVD